MTPRTIQSEAFRRAALGSERIRILWLLGVLVALIVSVTVPTLITMDPQHLRFLPFVDGLLLAFVALELIRLAVVNQRIRTAQDLPAWTWVLNVAVETLLPTLVILLLTSSSVFAPEVALVAPPVLFYFLFIILSTLRLSPLLCSLTGLLSAGGYLAVAAYVRWQSSAAAAAEASFPVTRFVLMGAILLALGGFVAAAVARRIERHVRAALREAEERRRAEHLEHDLNIARSIQQRLLPRSAPDVGGFDIALWNQPADQTGGDYYDWMRATNGDVVLSLADVSGHGIGPALLTADCHAYWRAIVPQGGSLGEMLTRLDQLLAADMPSDRFITFVAAWVEPRPHGVQLLSAGHGPLLVYTAADRRVQFLKSHGLPLGVDAAFEYGLGQRFDLSPGDAIVLATDGFFEWPNRDGEQFGIQRLGETVRAAADSPAQKIISRMYADVVSFADGTSQQDDVTAIVIKRAGDSAVSA